MNIDLSTIQARKALAQKYALKHILDSALVAAVCEQESGWNPWAVRFEPGFLSRYVHPVDPLKPTTMEILKATSFGLMQVMGEVAIELGWSGRFLTELCDPDIGVDFGCKKLAQCLDHNSGDQRAALLAYNGGSDLSYPDQVMARMSVYY